MLTMRSAPAGPPEDDRTARARIRDAAIARIAEEGPGASVRAIAAGAGVSPALVLHHFGSKEALWVSCDAHFPATIRERKHAAMAAGPGLDPLAALREQAGGPPLLRYLARVLIEPSPRVDALVDELVADAEQYMAEGVRSGLLKPSADPSGRAALLTLWSLGALVLHEHLHRLLGVDLVAGTLDPDAAAGYFGPALELFAGGLLTPEAAAQLRAAVAPESASLQEGAP
jgi:AcrR family transcriptional regulator